LDSLSDNICIYNLNCVLEKRVTPKSAKDKKDIVILDFCWSSPQSRVSSFLHLLNLPKIAWSNVKGFLFDILGG